MANKRISDDIKLGTLYGVDWPDGDIPRPDPTRGLVFVSHEESLRRDLEIINARTVAELGPLPPGGFPVQFKYRVDAKGRPLPAPTDQESKEDEAMKISHVTALAALTSVAVVGCAQQSAGVPNPPNDPSAPSAISDERSIRVDVPQSATPLGSPALHKICGTAKIWLRCDGDKCFRTSLSLQDAEGRLMDINPPPEISEYTAVGIDCVTVDDGSYLIVQYGERPYGCKFCEWYHLYDSSGNLLTHSNPPILIDDDLPEGQKQMPNNTEFDAMADELGIKAINIETLGRP